MTDLCVPGPRRIQGTVRVPGDKSVSHRALLLAALADGTSTVRGLSSGDDVRRTAAAVIAMGAVVEGERITGGVARLHEPDHVLDVGNSGTAIRLLAGWSAARPWLTVLHGDASIARRPMDRVVDPLRAMGASVDGRDDGRYPPLVVRGGPLRGVAHEPPVASAQVKGAVLLAGLGADGDTVVHERVATRRHTEELLIRARVDVVVDGTTVRLRPGPVQPFDLDVPGDPSQAAFWVVAGCITAGSDVTVEHVYVGPGRAGFLDVLDRMGADIDVRRHDDGTADIRATTSALRGTTVSAAEFPDVQDEIPVLAVAASVAHGETRFDGVGELRVKESDRVATTGALVHAFGGRVEGSTDTLVVHGRGPGSLRAAVVDAGGDHRIAMAAAIAGAAADGETLVTGWEAVATSYPGFEEVLDRCAS